MKIRSYILQWVGVVLLVCCGNRMVFAAANQTVTIAVEAEQFQYPGDWTKQDNPIASGHLCLTSGQQGAPLAAATEIEIPRADRYYLWVRAMDFPQDRPGTRRFKVSLGAQKSEKIFGASGQPNFTWELGGAFELPKGPLLIGLQAVSAFARADAVLLTTDPKLKPTQKLGAGGLIPTKPKKIAIIKGNDPLASQPATGLGNEPAARLENEFLRVEFCPATRAGKPTLCPRVAWKTAAGWMDAHADAASEIYSVVAAAGDTKFSMAGIYPTWKGAQTPSSQITVEAGGVQLKTAPPRSQAVWNAGDLVRFLPRAARVEAGKVLLDFYPSEKGSLAATWELRPGEHAARVQLSFTPKIAGEFALGYHLCFRQPLASVKEILLPFMWHRHRLPEQPRTLLDPFAPTPVSLAEVQTAGQSAVWGVIGDPAEIPFQWPGAQRPHFGLQIRDEFGAVQPSIYGPIPGTDAAKGKPGQVMRFAFRVLAQPGDWYAGYRIAADEIFGLRDYRSNTGVSLSDAVLNMIDLVKDDQYGGWWDRAKAWYQIESKNGSTHASPLALLAFYRLTGDTDLYRRRALPTMEFALSRSAAHFSPIPDDTGRYDIGSMDGPIHIYGTTTYGGFWEMSQRRTPAFRDIALPPGDIKPVATSHAQLFDEWLARFEMTGETNALQKACELADHYLEAAVDRAPDAEIGMQPFFYITFVPDWEGLLRLYEATGNKRYLEAAALGARQLMTGVWTHPVFPQGDVKIHPGGQFTGDAYQSWRGPEKFRLGTPRKPNDTPEHKVPAWTVSNVGLSFEQPCTIQGREGHRLIFQNAWAPEFLRLAEYTGDRRFETYARNATVGRWGNYPGYYITGFTDMPFGARYPFVGPDVNDFYYHHIVPHLAWCFDYLVAEASLRSAGKIRFPSQRQVGYAYFDSRVYGHAPGKIFGQDGFWLWLKRGVVTLNNPQINYLTAHNGKQLVAILMNESSKAEPVSIRFAASELKSHPASLALLGSSDQIPLRDGAATLTIPARGLTVLRLDNVDIQVPTHTRQPEPKASAAPGYLTLKTDAGFEVRAAALQTAPGSWDAYVWCTASAHQARQATLHYQSDRGPQQQQVAQYPYEFSIPVSASSQTFRFHVEGETEDGKKFKTPEATLGVTP